MPKQKMNELLVLQLMLLLFLSCTHEKEEGRQKQVSRREARKEIKAARSDTIRFARGKRIFVENCQVCHSKNDELVVGPGLAGITQRQSREQIKKWIHNSTRLIMSGDSYAVQLYEKYNFTVMPGYPEMSDREIDALLYYIEQK